MMYMLLCERRMVFMCFVMLGDCLVVSYIYEGEVIQWLK